MNEWYLCRNQKQVGFNREKILGGPPVGWWVVCTGKPENAFGRRQVGPQVSRSGSIIRRIGASVLGVYYIRRKHEETQKKKKKHTHTHARVERWQPIYIFPVRGSLEQAAVSNVPAGSRGLWWRGSLRSWVGAPPTNERHYTKSTDQSIYSVRCLAAYIQSVFVCGRGGHERKTNATP